MKALALADKYIEQVVAISNELDKLNNENDDIQRGVLNKRINVMESELHETVKAMGSHADECKLYAQKYLSIRAIGEELMKGRDKKAKEFAEQVFKYIKEMKVDSAKLERLEL